MKIVQMILRTTIVTVATIRIVMTMMIMIKNSSNKIKSEDK